MWNYQASGRSRLFTTWCIFLNVSVNPRRFQQSMACLYLCLRCVRPDKRVSTEEALRLVAETLHYVVSNRPRPNSLVVSNVNPDHDRLISNLQILQYLCVCVSVRGWVWENSSNAQSSFCRYLATPRTVFVYIDVKIISQKQREHSHQIF